jgi:two-component system, LuxR family, response regulator FixJ
LTDQPVVFVVDDDPAVLRSTAALLSVRGFKVRTWPSAEAFLGDHDRSEPACLLLDVRMPGMSGLELQRQLGHMRAALPIVIMTGHADVPMAVEAMRAGAIDFIEKPFAPRALVESLERAFRSLREGPGERDPEAEEALRRLTERERDVLELLVRGHTNKAIAYELDISQRTVEVHRAHIKDKLNARGLADLMRIMRR